MNNEAITINEYGKAINDYSGRAEDELTFEEEDVIILSLKDETGEWFYGELNGSRGWFPSSKVRILSDKECISESLPWPPQSPLMNSSCSSFSIKSSLKDSSNMNIRNRCNSKDSFTSVGSSVNHVTIPTANEDTSNPTLPTPQVRSWYSKYQQIKRYQPKRGPNNVYQCKVGNSALSNPPIAASNLSEKSSQYDDRKTFIATCGLPESIEALGNSNSNLNESLDKQDMSTSLEEKEKMINEGTNEEDKKEDINDNNKKEDSNDNKKEECNDNKK